ncbi:MAG: nicotinate-nucleotide--dimethylbenzimidazole phosphoribosyltransferase [Parasporobacterium sp.]|nr:nicotinate-nucleotide--dimethylbenzimidazole phosphoribosyltransferase [Parasporobacterium sp.]
MTDKKLQSYTELSEISPFDEGLYTQIQKNWDSVAKPLNSLGKFEDMIARIGAVLGTTDVDIKKRAVIMMCADNGIVEEGISQSGQDVTAAVAEWMGRNESSVCKMAKVTGTDTIPVDIGINMEGSPEGVLSRKVRKGTANFLKEPAMTEEEFQQALTTGIEVVHECKEEGYRILATGEMGIGNTTTSAAVCAALMNLPVIDVTGRGAGISSSGLLKKIEVIDKAMELYDMRNRYDKSREFTEYVLRSVGGLDIAGLTGVFLGGAIYHVPIVIDGFISLVSALAAERILPGTREVMLASHKGKEQGMRPIFEELDLDPSIDGNLALGEGTGAVMLFPLLEMALSLYSDGLSFEETTVEQYEHFSE